jgi:hypothetical protein
LLPTLHIDLGLKKNFIKAINKQAKDSEYLRKKFPELSDAKLKEGIVENNQHCALNCTTPLFYIMAPTWFGSSLPSSGSFLDPYELLEIQTENY